MNSNPPLAFYLLQVMPLKLFSWAVAVKVPWKEQRSLELDTEQQSQKHFNQETLETFILKNWEKKV